MEARRGDSDHLPTYQDEDRQRRVYLSLCVHYRGRRTSHKGVIMQTLRPLILYYIFYQVSCMKFAPDPHTWTLPQVTK
jgi:hypothetical protein